MKASLTYTPNLHFFPFCCSNCSLFSLIVRQVHFLQAKRRKRGMTFLLSSKPFKSSQENAHSVEPHPFLVYFSFFFRCMLKIFRRKHSCWCMTFCYVGFCRLIIARVGLSYVCFFFFSDFTLDSTFEKDNTKMHPKMKQKDIRGWVQR